MKIRSIVRSCLVLGVSAAALASSHGASAASSPTLSAFAGGETGTETNIDYSGCHFSAAGRDIDGDAVDVMWFYNGTIQSATVQSGSNLVPKGASWCGGAISGSFTQSCENVGKVPYGTLYAIDEVTGESTSANVSLNCGVP